MAACHADRNLFEGFSKFGHDKKKKKKKFKQYRIIAGGKKAMQSIVLFLAATALGCSKK